MATKQLPVDIAELQSAIYRVALSLDSFLMNGIQYGVLERAAPDGFLERAANSLWSELARLEELVPSVPSPGGVTASEISALLRARCQELVDLIMGLRALRTLPVAQVRQSALQVPILREACVHLIQQLEACLGTSKPFYQTRPARSTAAVNNFLTSLEQCFLVEWNAGRERSSTN